MYTILWTLLSVLWCRTIFMVKCWEHDTQAFELWTLFQIQ
jgi:hypothetical protein